MKKILLSLILFNSFAFAQVGIGNTNPTGALDVSSSLALPSTNKAGLVPPTVSLSATNSTVTTTVGVSVVNASNNLVPVVGTLVYNTNTSAVGANQVVPGYYYYNGTNWDKLNIGNNTVAEGGTGTTTLTGILKGNGTSAITAVTGTQWGSTYWSDSNTISSTAAGVSGQFLKSNATSAPSWSNVINNSQSSSAQPTSTLTWTTLQTVIINTTGSPIQLFATTQFRESSTTTRQLFRLRITKDGVSDGNVIAEGLVPTFGTNTFYADANCNLNWQETPTSGNHTYYLQYNFSSVGAFTWLTKGLIINEIR